MLISFITAIGASSQKTISLHATVGSGVSYFRGSGAVDNSIFYRNGQPFPNSIDTPGHQFGRRSVTNFMAGVQANLRLIPSLILTVDALLEHSGGELTIDSVRTPSGNFKTNGEYKRKYNFLSINPQLGRRISIGPAGIRVSAGVDYCLKLSRNVVCNYTDLNGQKNSIGGSGGEPEINDIRLTAGLTVNFKKIGLNVVYKHGVLDYMRDRPGQVYSRLVHVRLLYRLLGV